MLNNRLSEHQANRYLLFFLIGWTALNVLQAATLGVHSDEAYYWIYSRFLDWGYFDHPPMVALFIRLGDTVLQNELGLRLMTVFSSSLSVYLLWLMARRYLVDVRWFIAVFSSILAFHIYGFTTTPDAPLLFFTILFYYVYQQYLQRNNWRLAVALGIIVALLLYSKYHGVLLLLFTLIANPHLFKRGSFWLILVLASGLYAPHIWWQVQHGYPSVNYHLFERSSAVYEFKRTLEYLPGQLLMAGPLAGWLWFYYTFKAKSTDAFLRCLLFNTAGIFIFFWLNTVKGNVQPHWTLIGMVPVLLLALIGLKQLHVQALWPYRLAWVCAGLIVLFRLTLVAGLPFVKKLPTIKNYFYYREWTEQIKAKAGDNYVIIPVNFQIPSKYNYYTHSLKAFAYDVYDYRRTQYDIWPIEDSLQGKKAMLLTTFPLAGKGIDSLETTWGKWYYQWVNNVKTYQKIDIQPNRYKITARPGQQVTFQLQLANPYAQTVNFANSQEHEVALQACFYKDDEPPVFFAATADFNRLTIPAKQKGTYTFTCRVPEQKGKYDMVFSIRTTPFLGGRNSRVVSVTVQ
jgi:hypothetical protein